MLGSKKVRILLSGDSITEGDGNASAYRFEMFKNLYEAGANFAFVGANGSGDVRLPAAYSAHGGHCGYIIGSEELETMSIRNKLTQSAYRESVEQADMVCLWIGYNDHYQKRHEGMAERYLRLLDCFYEINPKLIMYCGTLFDNCEELNGFLRDFDTAAYQKAYGREVHIVEVHQPQYLPIKGSEDFPEDDGHPAEPGNVKLGRMWADAVLPRVLELNASGEEEDTRVRVRGVISDLTDVTLRPREGKTFHADVWPTDAEVHTVLWFSDAPDVARVDDYGKVVAEGVGCARITAMALDGHMCAHATVTVAGNAVDLARGLRTVYEESFATDDRWDGNVEMITPKYHKISFRWNTAADGTLTSKEHFLLGKNVYCQFTYSSANDRTRSRERFFSLTVGGVEIRISGGAKYASLYENGRLLVDDEALPASATKATYSFLRQGNAVAFYRNNELLGEAVLTLPSPAEDQIRITFGKLNHKNYVCDLFVASDD